MNSFWESVGGLFGFCLFDLAMFLSSASSVALFLGQGKDGNGQEMGMACMVWNGKGKERGEQRDTRACLLEVDVFCNAVGRNLYSTIHVQNHLRFSETRMRVYAELKGPAPLHLNVDLHA